METTDIELSGLSQLSRKRTRSSRVKAVTAAIAKVVVA
jgi:hypothetical protein